MDPPGEGAMTENQDNNANPIGPLSGIRVLEYGVFHAGPGAGAILGDLGADVIKIESGFGDPERYWTSVGGLDISGQNGESVMFDVSNRNKKGIYLDIQPQKGREIFNKLISQSDVFLTNLRKSTKKKLEIDYAPLAEINPQLIHANVSGYGPEGPLSDIGAFDPMGQARSAMMYLCDHEKPHLLHLAILDQAAAIAVSHAILAALVARGRSGKGMEVHTSLFSSGMWLMYANLILGGFLGIDPNIPWIRERHSPLRNSFRCQDGKWIIGVHHPEEKYWERFCKATGQEELLADPDMATSAQRERRCSELVTRFDAVIAKKNSDRWMEIFTSCGLMFSPCQRIPDILKDPQAAANEYIVDFDHPRYGLVKIPGYPSHFSGFHAGTRKFAPAMGEHSREILREAGYSDEEVEKLADSGVIR
jgi:crotonobetainyl-CoA:carnitine CoA-transferase CaiB-like acyl-CoA transferase